MIDVPSLQAWAGVSSTQDPALFAMLESQVVRAVEQWTDRYFGPPLLYTEARDGRGSSTMFLREVPLVAVAAASPPIAALVASWRPDMVTAPTLYVAPSSYGPAPSTAGDYEVHLPLRPQTPGYGKLIMASTPAYAVQRDFLGGIGYSPQVNGWPRGAKNILFVYWTGYPSYSAKDISFAGSTITAASGNLAAFAALVGGKLTIVGSTGAANDGAFQIVSATATTIVVSGAFATLSAGAAIYLSTEPPEIRLAVTSLVGIYYARRGSETLARESDGMSSRDYRAGLDSTFKQWPEVRIALEMWKRHPMGETL